MLNIQIKSLFLLNFISWKNKHQCVTSLIFIELELQLCKIYRYCIKIGRIYVYWIVLKFSVQYTCSFRCTGKCYHIKKQADTLPPTPTPTLSQHQRVALLHEWLSIYIKARVRSVYPLHIESDNKVKGIW